MPRDYYELPYLTPLGDWARQAACKGMDTDLFFPARGELGQEAKAVCARCPVTAECLHHALVAPEKDGVWGAKSARERRGSLLRCCTRCGVEFLRGSIRTKICPTCREESRRETIRRQYLERSA